MARSPSMLKVSKIWTALLVVFLLFLLFFVVYQFDASRWGQSGQQVESTQVPGPKIIKVPVNQLPRLFPEGVFMETDAKVVENYNTEFNDGKIWATRVYETNVPFAQVQDDYENYLSTLNGWTRNKSYSRGNDVFLSASTTALFLVIHVSDGENRNTASIRFITRLP